MNRILFLIIMLYLVFPSAFGQYMVAVGGGDPVMNASTRDTIAQCDIRVKYELKFMPDTLKRDQYKTQAMVLRMNTKGVSQYQEYGNFRSDSVSAARTRNGKIKLSDTNEAIKYRTKARDNITIAKSWPEKSKILVKEIIGFDGTFYYTENKPEFNWEIDFSQTKEVAGYVCHAAKGTYAGRDYQAWFTTDIPISDGPWLFCGLPGLILEVSSLDEEFLYTCMSIQEDTGLIMLRELDTAFKTTRERFLKAKERYKVNPAAGVAAMVEAGKLQTTMNLKNRKPRAYNPQEKY
ncbi:MAG: GLPGLI family protein [Bacteroides sp.]|nr:GLPGLI family protein [Bacteroides sp.]